MLERHYYGRILLWWWIVEAVIHSLYYLVEFMISGFSETASLLGAGLAAVFALIALLILYGRGTPVLGGLSKLVFFGDIEDRFVRKGALWFMWFAIASLMVAVPLLISTSLAGEEIFRGRFVRSLPYIVGALVAILVVSLIVGLAVRPVRKNAGD